MRRPRAVAHICTFNRTKEILKNHGLLSRIFWLLFWAGAKKKLAAGAAKQTPFAGTASTENQNRKRASGETKSTGETPDQLNWLEPPTSPASLVVEANREI